MIDRPLPAYLVEFWRHVASTSRSGTPSEFAEHEVFRALMRQHRVTAAFVLERLAKERYLRVTQASRFQRIFWFSDLCRVPEGQVRPNALPAGAEKATPRAHVNAQMPDDHTPLMQPQSGPAFDYLLCPSRSGNRLTYRDGRVTDLQGNPL